MNSKEIYEKFTQGSDPIKDLGIGIYSYRDFNTEIEAIKWLEDLDGVLLVMDSTEDPFTQVNVTILGNLEARNLPVLIAANKIDRPKGKENFERSAKAVVTTWCTSCSIWSVGQADHH
jgi:predicted GTPase